MPRLRRPTFWLAAVGGVGLLGCLISSCSRQEEIARPTVDVPRVASSPASSEPGPVSAGGNRGGILPPVDSVPVSGSRPGEQPGPVPALENTAWIRTWQDRIAHASDGELPGLLEMLARGAQSQGIEQLEVAMVRRLAGKNPAMAASLATKLPPGAARKEAMAAAAVAWTQAGLDQAADWARRLPDPVERNTMGMQVAYEASRFQPVKALALAVEQPATSARNDLIRHTAMQWAAEDPAASVAWAKKIQDDSLRSQVLSAVVTAWAETNPVAAAQALCSELDENRDSDNAAVGIVQRWAQSDPKKAADWVRLFPEGHLKETAVANLVTLWTRSTPAEAATWIATLPPGPVQTAAQAAYESARR